MPNPTDTRATRLSVLVACASVLQVAEALLPYPLPGIRLGLANLVTLIALVQTGPADAFALALLRSLTSSLVLGTFLSPSFLLSFSGAIASATLMVLLYRLGRARPALGPSLIGISVAGSTGHVLAQVAVVYLIFVRSPGVLLLWPWLALSGAVMGIITGVVAVLACRRLDATPPALAGPDTAASAPALVSRPVPADSLIHRLPAEAKLLAVMAIAVAVVFLRSYLALAVAFGALALVAALARARLASLLLSLRRLTTFSLLTFLLPLLWTRSGPTLLSLGPVQVTAGGVAAGTVLSLRVILLFLATTLLSLTTSPAQLADGLARLCSPLPFARTPARELGQVLGLSWSFYPLLWEQAVDMLRKRPGQRLTWASAAAFLPDLVAGLYRRAEALARPAALSDTRPRASQPPAG
jgi:heptaprenyl diphosphate synthase